MKPFKPMLASPFDEALLKFPVLASPKLDGVRAIVRDGVVLSRSLKPIPNKWVQQRFSHLEHFDGELIVGKSNHPDVLRTTTSGVMRVAGEPDVSFHVFDHVASIETPYIQRYGELEKVIKPADTYVVPQEEIGSLFELNAFERDILAQGWEGVMLRRFDAPYKFGRSTAREGYLLKVKRFHDDEFEIVGFEEEMFNANEATTSELGRTKRSSHKANKVPKGRLGALVLKYGDTTFNCGTGFNDAERERIWAERERYLGQFAKIKYFAHGIKDVPKLPSFLGIRDVRDM